MNLDFTADPGEWQRWCAELGVDDVYYRARYAAAWQDEEGGQALVLRMRSAEGAVLYPVIKVPLEALDGGAGRFDLRVAYDFGGPLAIGPNPTGLQELFAHALDELARDLRVVSEFGRLHPYANTALPAGAVLHGEHFHVDLADGAAELDQADPRHRSAVRAGQRGGTVIEFALARTCDARRRETFERLYADTMDRLEAARDYRFRAATLHKVLALDEIYLATAELEGEIAAASLFVHSRDTLFYYLSASDPRFRSRRVNNLLLDQVARRAAALGCKRFHLGGGHESLRYFKQQIGRHTTPYHLLRRIHDPAAYAALSAAHAGDGTTSFPAYRPRLLGLRRD